MKERFNKLFSIFLALVIVFQVYTSAAVMATNSEKSEPLKEGQTEIISQEEKTKEEQPKDTGNKESKTIIETKPVESKKEVKKPDLSDDGLGTKVLSQKQIEASTSLLPGQSLIFKAPKVNYQVGGKLDLSSIEILIKDTNNQARILDYDHLLKNKEIEMNLKSGDTIGTNYYNPLFDKDFLEKESQSTKSEISKYIEENKIEYYDPELTITIPNFKPINIKLELEDSDLKLSPLELFRALKMKESSIITLSADKLTYKVDEKIKLDDFRFLLKDEKGILKIIDGRDLGKEDIKVDFKKVEEDKKTFIGQKDKKEPCQTYITLSKKAYEDLYIPVTLITDDKKDSYIYEDNFDISTWGLKLDEKSIYTVTLDVKSLSDIKDIKLNFLNALDKEDKDIKIDRIVKTDGVSEEDISLTDPIYRDRENIKDYKDLPQKQIKEKLEKLEIKNPIELSKTLEVGYKYVFFIEKNEKSNEKESKLLLEIEAKTQDEKTIRKEIEALVKEVILSQNFNTIVDSREFKTTNSKGQGNMTVSNVKFKYIKRGNSDQDTNGKEYISPNSGGLLNVEFDVNINETVKQGDYFYFHAKDYLDTRGIEENNQRGFNITNNNGEVVAVLTDISGTRDKEKITFVKDFDKVSLHLSLNLTIDRYAADKQGDYKLNIDIGGQNINIDSSNLEGYTNKDYLDKNGIYVNYAEAFENSSTRQSGVFNKYDSRNNTFEVILYGNPNKLDSVNSNYDLKNPTFMIYERGEKQKGSVLKIEKEGIRVYRVDSKVLLPDSIAVDDTFLRQKATDVTAQSTIERNKKVNEQWKIIPPNEGGKYQYVVRIKGEHVDQNQRSELYSTFYNNVSPIAITVFNTITTSNGFSDNDNPIITPPKPGLGEFFIKKVDKNKRPLKGAIFLLEGNGINKTIESNGNEEAIKIGDLKPGTYKLKETKSPDGYTKTNETATITVDEKGNTTIKSNSTSSQDITVEDDQKKVLSYDNKDLNIVIAVENKHPKGSTERYSHYRTTAASIYNAFKNTPGLNGKVNIILAGTNANNTSVVTFDIGSEFQFPENNSVEGWMDQAFTKASPIFRDSPTTENILITLFEGKYNGSNADKALKELSNTNINKVFNYTYSETWLQNINNSLINRYNNLNINSNIGFKNMISKSMFDQNRDFYVSEYITGLDKDKNITTSPKGSHIKENTINLPTVTISNEISGKFTINKTDEDGKALKEAEFKLSKKTTYGENNSTLPETYQVKGEFQTQTKTTQNGKVDFDSLPPGTYDLEETKSPDGYIKDMRKFVVVVQKDGKTYVVDATTYKPESYPLEGDIQKPNIDIDESKARTSPMNLDGRIEVTGYKMFTKERNSYGNMVESQSSNVDASVQALWMKANLEFPEDTIVGDTFTIVLDENLDMRGVSLEDKTQKSFVDEKGNELAKHINTSKVNGKYVFTYQITKKPENADQLILSLERPVYVNRNKIWQSSYTDKTFINTIAGNKQTQSQQFSIIYNSFKSPNKNGYEVGNEPYIYPSSNRVDVYVQAMTAPGNHILKLTDSNLDFSNAEVTISTNNSYGYIGVSKDRPASFGTEIMDFKTIVESKNITKGSQEIQIELPGDPYQNNFYNIKVTGVKRISSSTEISTTSAIYSYYTNYPVVSYTKKLAAISGESKGKYIKTPKITVKKTDETGQIFLPGAEFKLENNQIGYSQIRTTNSRGELVFTGIKQTGDYILTETKTPEGYKILNNNRLSVYVDYKPGTESDGSLDDVSIRNINNLPNASVSGNTITVKNKKGPYTPPEVKFANYPNHIQFTKVDEKGNPLKGAKFKLILDKDDKEVANSEREGSLISYEKLAPGNYQVRETEQPKGYLTPKENNNTVATFTVKDDGSITDVKTYSLEGKLVESKDEHKIYNIPKDGKGEFTIYKKAYKNASGDKEGVKIALTGAEFTLSKMQKEKGNPEDLPKTFNNLVKTVAREDGSLKFDSLDPGVYELKETKSPAGYKKSDDVYVVVVAKSGKTTIVPQSAYTPESFPVDDIITDTDKETSPNTRTEVKNLDNEIKVSNYYFDQKDNQGTVKHHKAQAITMRYTITLPRDIIPGDYFTIDLDDKLDLNGIELTEEFFDDLKNEYGEVIAKAEKTKNGGKNSYTFTLTEYVKGKTNITVSGEDNFFVDPNVVKTSGNQTFTNKLGKQSGSRQLYVDYNPYFGNGSDNHGVYYDTYGRAISQYYNNYISAKHYVNRETGKTEIYYYVYGYNNMPNNYNFDLTNYTSDGKSSSVYFDSSTQVEVYKVDNPFKQNYYGELVTDQYGSLVVNENKVIPSLGDKAVLQANTNNITPNIKWQKLEPQDYSYTKYNRLKFYLGEQNGVFGYLIKVTTPFDQNSSKPLVVEGEVKQEYYYKARNNYGYISDFYGNSSLYHNLWIEQYGSSRQGDADKLLNIKLTKQELLDGKAEGKFIPGAGFRLQSRDGYTAYKKTDEKGELTFENVPEGTYALTETFTPQGYNHPVSAWIIYVRYDYTKKKSKIEIKDVNNLIKQISDNELKVYNSKEEIKYPTMEYLNIPNRIEFTKVDYKDTPLQNVSFELRKKQENSTAIQTATSGTDGKFAFEKIAPGDYEVWETKAQAGYKTPDKAVATFTVDKDGKIINLQIDGKAVQEGSGNKIVNKKLGKIDFMKVKAHEGQSVDDKFIPNDKNSSPLQGAVFELQKLAQNDGGTSQYKKIKEVNDYTDGKISFTDLEEGSYKLIEIKAPDGYKKPSYDVATFDIKADGEVANLTVNGKAVKLKNDKEVSSKDEVDKEDETNKIEMTSPYRILNTKEAKLKIVKKDAETKTLLGGAIFELYRIKNGQDSKLDPNSDGFDMTKLEKYSKKTKDDKDYISWVDSDSKSPTTQIITSSDGKLKGTATITGLSDGIYWLKETKSPIGYVPYGKFIGAIEIKNGKVNIPKNQKEPLTLSYDEDEQMNVATITNKKPVYPPTGGIGSFIYTILGTSLMAIAYMSYRRKKLVEK